MRYTLKLNGVEKITEIKETMWKQIFVTMHLEIYKTMRPEIYETMRPEVILGSYRI